MEFAPKWVRWVKFEVNDAVGSHIGLSEIEAFPPAGAGGDFVSQVDPFIETTKGRYFFFITGNQPFGMIGAAPLTRNRNQYGGGYNYNSTEVLGIPQIHNWVLAGLTLMPTTGNVDPTLGEGHWKSHFRHEGEIAQPGYHRLFLEDYGIWVEQTATDRTGFYRLTFTRDAEADILLNLGCYLVSTTMCNARVRRVGEHEIEGSFDTYGRHWGGPENVRVYFVVRFDRPFDRLDGWAGTRRYSGIDSLEGFSEITRRHPRETLSYLDSPTSGVAAHYGVRTGDRIHVRTAVSYVSTENARENLTHDAATWDFNAVRRTAQDEWNEWLGCIEVKGGTQQQRTKFYTDLWHILPGRHKIDDVNGEYPDLTDGQRTGYFTRNIRVKTRTLPRDAEGRVVHHMYNSDAFWLTQWNLNVLWGLGWPEMPDEMSASLIRYADNGGLIPRATTPDRGYGRARRRPGANGRCERTDVDRVVQYAGHGCCPPRIRGHLAGLRRGVDPSRQALLPGRPLRPVRYPHLRQFGQELLYPTRTPQWPHARQLLVPARRIRTRRPARAMAGARAQHPLGNRETPRIAAGIFPIGGASGQRLRRYFFGASPPGEGGGREQREKAENNGRSREQCGCRNARNARQRRPPREPAGGGNLPGRRQHRASRRLHVHTNSPQRPQMHAPARRQSPAQGIGDRSGTVRTRLRKKTCRQTGTIH